MDCVARKGFSLERIQEDERGSIYKIILDGDELFMLYTRRGYRRGGDYHPRKTHCYMFMGKGLWVTRKNGKLSKKMQKQNTDMQIGAGIAHYFEALEEKQQMNNGQIPA